MVSDSDDTTVATAVFSKHVALLSIAGGLSAKVVREVVSDVVSAFELPCALGMIGVEGVE